MSKSSCTAKQIATYRERALKKLRLLGAVKAGPNHPHNLYLMNTDYGLLGVTVSEQAIFAEFHDFERARPFLKQRKGDGNGNAKWNSHGDPQLNQYLTELESIALPRRASYTLHVKRFRTQLHYLAHESAAIPPFVHCVEGKVVGSGIVSGREVEERYIEATLADKGKGRFHEVAKLGSLNEVDDCVRELALGRSSNAVGKTIINVVRALDEQRAWTMTSRRSTSTFPKFALPSFSPGQLVW